MLLRGYKREATAILQKDPDILRSIVQVPASSIANIMAQAKDNVARQLAALVNFQTSPESLKYSSSDTYFENNQGFKQTELLVQPIKAEEYSSNVTLFLSRNVNSPYLQQHRGFKTLRSEKEEDLTSTEDLIKKILKKGNPTKEEIQQITNMLKNVELSQDEKKQVLLSFVTKCGNSQCGNYDRKLSTPHCGNYGKPPLQNIFVKSIYSITLQ